MTNERQPEVLLEGRYLRMLRRGRWEYVERIKPSGIAVIVAVTAADELLFVEQLRPPLGERVIELPAGLVGDVAGSEDEGIEEAARRELLEETGYRAGELELLTEGPVSPGLSTEVVSVFLARGAERVSSGGGDASEDIAVHAVPVAAADGWLEARRREGVLVDAKVYTGLYFAQRDG
jgi:ADP-ribose pyrophosphatase